jgi:hypothetical protein
VGHSLDAFLGRLEGARLQCGVHGVRALPAGHLSMAAQAKIGAALTATATVAWAAYVFSERSELPQGRRRKFSPGSADEVMSGDLRDGDLVLFSRNCALYYPCGAAACALSKRFGGSEFDHAGVIVMHRGEPHIAEATFGGVRMRPFDERVICSRAFNVAVRRLATPLSASLKRSLRDAAVAEASDTSSQSSPESLGRWLAATVSTGPSEAARVVPMAFPTRLLERAGLMSDAKVSLSDIAPDLSSTSLPRRVRLSPHLEYADTLWFRDRVV